MLGAKVIDGEAFAEKITNWKLRTPVRLDIRLSEVDHWQNPLHDGLGQPNEDDGIFYDTAGNPTDTGDSGTILHHQASGEPLRLRRSRR